MAAVAAATLLSLSAAPAGAQALTEARFGQIMDGVFGPGAWRMTGGYRTPEREDQLRAQGAMTVRPGGLSRHSLGRPGAPGAFDLVVDGLSPSQAAERLRRANAPFAFYQPKGAHGTQGPHLHLQPYGFGAPPAGPRVQMASADTAKDPADKPRAQAATIIMPSAGAGSLASAQRAFAGVLARASQGEVQAQIEVGQAYALGYPVDRDFIAARLWLVEAADNPAIDRDTRQATMALLTQVQALLEADRAQQPTRYAGLKVDAGR